MEYIPTIGLEIHAELKTISKMFCPCGNDPDEEKPNVNICPICLGHPGTLPVLNMKAIEHVLRMGVAVDGTLADFTEWDRKNYFYPDIPKGYQISQYKFPLVSGGELSGVALERIHLEEDTAQSTHDIEVGPRGQTSLVNFNRAGVPLMELVTKPVIHDATTAVRFAKELQLLLRYLGVSEANMEKGEMRVEANISVSSPADMKAGRFGVKTEVKNLNSFRSVERAIEYEIGRQIALIEKGEKVVQETRGWDDSKNETYSQRSKESSHDYRYFPDPDIPKMKISEIPEFSVASLSKDMPELPWVKRDRYQKEYGMTDKEVAVFVESPRIAGHFESIIKESGIPNDKEFTRLATNYLLTDYLGLLKKEKFDDPESLISSITPYNFAELMLMIKDGQISSRGAKDLLNLAVQSYIKDKKVFSSSFKDLAEKHNLLQKSDAADIEPIIEKVIADSAKVVAEYKAGKIASLQFLIGQAMKVTKGAANPTVIKELLVKKLG
jgi:aspartyl-tRNA(Asn)/glutamyl-tRNA(Gln) amidotransferase subunit B